MLCHMTLCELCHLWRLLTPNFSTNDCTHRKHCSNSLGLILEYSSKRIWLGFRMVVLETSTTTLLLSPSISSQPCAPAITAKIAIVMISVSKWHLSTLGSFTCVKYSWNLLVMSKLSTLGIKDVSVFLFFSSQILLTLLWAARWIKSYPSSDSASLFPTLLLIKQVRLSIGFETR